MRNYIGVSPNTIDHPATRRAVEDMDLAIRELHLAVRKLQESVKPVSTGAKTS